MPNKANAPGKSLKNQKKRDPECGIPLLGVCGSVLADLIADHATDDAAANCAANVACYRRACSSAYTCTHEDTTTIGPVLTRCRNRGRAIRARAVRPGLSRRSQR